MKGLVLKASCEKERADTFVCAAGLLESCLASVMKHYTNMAYIERIKMITFIYLQIFSSFTV